MSNKREFPKSWTEFDDNEKLENIRYLLKNYRKYDITIESGCLHIGNVVIRHLSSTPYAFYLLNNWVMADSSESGILIEKLIEVCAKEYEKRSQKSDHQPKEQQMPDNKKNIVSEIILYINRTMYGDTYAIDYKYHGDKTVYRRTFVYNFDGANKFLKKLYENVGVRFYHYNDTMEKYDKNAPDAYFFTFENTKSTFLHGYPILIDNLKPLRKAYKNMFGERLKPNKEQIVSKTKMVFFPLLVAAAVVSPLWVMINQMNKQEKKLQEMEIKTQEHEEYITEKIKQIDEIKARKDNAVKDTMQNGN